MKKLSILVTGARSGIGRATTVRLAAAGYPRSRSTSEASMSSRSIENLQAAMTRAMAIRPRVGGFPVLAETLRQAGVRRNIWHLPAAQSLYLTDHGAVVNLGTPLATGFADVPSFDREALIRALRTDQAGESTFPEFLLASWKAGVIRYEVDFDARQVTYYGYDDENYVEAYPAVTISG